MALKGDYIYKSLTISNAYCMLSETSSNTYISVLEDGEQKKVQFNYQIRIYASEEARTAKPNEFVCIVHGSFDQDLSASSKNFAIQCYDKLKTLDEFSGFTDV